MVECIPCENAKELLIIRDKSFIGKVMENINGDPLFVYYTSCPQDQRYVELGEWKIMKEHWYKMVEVMAHSSIG